MKKSIWMLLVAAWALGVCAGPVSREMAIAAANAWAAKNAAFEAGTVATGEVLTVGDPANASVVLWHQVSMKDGGMLVVAPVTEIEPVVVALDNDPGELPAGHPLRGILMGDMRRRLQFLGLYPAASGGATLSSVAPAAPVVTDEAKAWGESGNAKWARLMGASLQEAAGVGVTDITVDIRTVEGFEKGGVLTHWNQGSYNGAYLFNLYTPKHAVCGCVATACAALAQFYGTTNAALVTKTCSYNKVEGEYTTRPGPIDWGILPENWGGTNTPVKATDKLSTEQQDLLGAVAYNAGVGVSMQWTDSESGAFTSDIVTALKEVFGFRNARYVGISPADQPDEAQLAKLMYNQVRAGVPVGFSIEGHAVVAVGFGLDADNIERVRVFMGWGGAGDGWYALPKIDTKATMNGGTYLSEVVNGIVTMISYDDDDIVPVVGHVSMPGAKLQLPALDREIESNDHGYFGTRVPCDLAAGDCRVTCMGKEATFEIGADAACSSEAEALTEALPDDFEFSLLNCTVAYSLKRAKEIALREGKAILRVGGKSSEAKTAAIIDYIYELDKENTDGFVDKFVYLFSSSSSKEGDGSDVSYGVFLPESVEPEDRWNQPQAARLAWGYAVTTVKATNDTHNVDHDVTEGEFATTNTYVYTYAPNAPEPTMVTTNAVDDVEAIRAGLLESIQAVLDMGARRYVEATSGIKVTIGAATEEAEAAINASADAANACGLHEACYAPGAVTFVCNAVVTNEAAGYVYGCAGWAVSNMVTGATQKGTGTEATFDVAAGDEVMLTWDVSKVIAVKATVVYPDEVQTIDSEAITPGSGWYPYGVPVLFEAKGKVGVWGFSKFIDANLSEAAIKLSPVSVLVPMDWPVTVEGVYRKGAQPSEPEAVTNTCAVTVYNYVFNLEAETADPAEGPVPATMVYSSEGVVEILDGATVDVPATTVGYAPAAKSYTTADGVQMELLGVMVNDEIDVTGVLPIRGELAEQEAYTVLWVWSPVDAAGEAPPTEFQIEWDDALTVLNAQSFSTNLLTKAQLEEFGIQIEDVTVSAPKGFKANLALDAAGNLVATLMLDEEVLRPVAADGVSSPLTIIANGDSSVTVKADVANGVRGFWYSLFAADELGGDWAAVKTGYEAGLPVVQAQADDTSVSVSIDVDPAVSATKRFFKLVVTDVEPGR